MGELIIYMIWERDQTDTDVNSTRIKERLIKCARPNSLQKVQQQCVSYTRRKFGRGYWLNNQNTSRQCCNHTSWGYSNWKQMMSNSTEFNGSFNKETVQQAVLMNHFALTNMIMHRTTTADQSGHGYHWVLLFNLMVLRNWLHLRILQLPLYSLYSLSGEGWKSGCTLQTWVCTLSYNTVQLGTKSVALKCHGISTTVICPACITASDCFRWSSCY